MCSGISLAVNESKTALMAPMATSRAVAAIEMMEGSVDPALEAY